MFANGHNRTRFLVDNSSLKITYSHIKNAASVRYCMKVDLVVLTEGGNMRPKKTATFTVSTSSFYYACAICFRTDKGAFGPICSLHSLRRTRNSPDSNNVHIQLLSFLEKVSTVLEGATEIHAHLISLAGHFCWNLQQQPKKKIRAQSQNYTHVGYLKSCFEMAWGWHLMKKNLLLGQKKLGSPNITGVATK